MSLLILADSQIERVWRSVRQDREILKTAEFVPVKRFNQMHDGFKAMKATVRLLTVLNGRVGICRMVKMTVLRRADVGYLQQGSLSLKLVRTV